MSYCVQKKNGDELNRFYEEDLPIHNWYRFVLSYPPHLVRQCIKRFNLPRNAIILDPFCGTGTTLVEAKKLGLSSIGIEANPVVQLCARTKVNWNLDINEIISESDGVYMSSIDEYHKNGYKYQLCDEKKKLIITNSISELPLKKTLVLVEKILKSESKYKDFFLTGLARELVFSFSNLKFGPEVGVSRKKKLDINVFELWKLRIHSMCDDLSLYSQNDNIYSNVILGDSINCLSSLSDNSIDAVITSPPYPNEKDYSRATRLESVLLGFISNKEDLRNIKKNLLRSNTRGIYKGDNNENWIQDHSNIINLANSIENKRLELNKTSGFEKLYHKVVLEYFGGMKKHLHDLIPKLRNGAKLAYVIGDQYSFFRIPIKTGEILEEIAKDLGYIIIGREVFRTRMATSTNTKINEEILYLEWSCNEEK